MRVLIGCERSRVVASAFEQRGHEVLSCDLESARKGGAHFLGDVLDVIDFPWDLAIFHPPCTHTAVSGAKHFAAKREDGRLYAGVSFIMSLVRRSMHIPAVVIEQPVSILSSLWRKPDQTIQPWMFGHAETKATCLWLRGCPPLVPTNVVEPDFMRKPDGSYYTDAKGKRYSRIHFMSGRKGNQERAELRSETYSGVAEAMAVQWSGSLNLERTA